MEIVVTFVLCTQSIIIVVVIIVLFMRLIQLSGSKITIRRTNIVLVVIVDVTRRWRHKGQVLTQRRGFMGPHILRAVLLLDGITSFPGCDVALPLPPGRGLSAIFAISIQTTCRFVEHPIAGDAFAIGLEGILHFRNGRWKAGTNRNGHRFFWAVFAIFLAHTLSRFYYHPTIRVNDGNFIFAGTIAAFPAAPPIVACVDDR